MGAIFRMLLSLPFFKPLMRLVIGMIAIPMFRWFLRFVLRMDRMDAELEKDLEQWFRGSLLLLVATKNLEDALFGWVPLDLTGKYAWIALGARLMLAIGVTEAMPDKALFQIIHANPPPLRKHLTKGWAGFKRRIWHLVKSNLCKHLDRSSQVFAILTAIFDGWPGWIFYTLAVVQFLIIGLVTSRDKAMGVLSEFDRQMQLNREWLIQELHLNPVQSVAATDGDDWHPPAKQPANLNVTKSGNVLVQASLESPLTPDSHHSATP